MNRQTATPEIIRSYLLGELDPDARRHLEETLMVNEEYYQEVLIAEDELIDRYLSGALDENERERFLRHFLITPGRRQKLEFARTFHTYVTNHAPQPSTAGSGRREQPARAARLFPFSRGHNSALRSAFALALLLLLVLGGSWAFWKSLQQPAPSSEARRNVLAVSLSPVLTRSAGEIRAIVIKPGVNTVRLELEPAISGRGSYRARLLTDEGAEVYNANALAPGGDGSIVIELPAELLPAGDYRLKLEGGEGGATEGAGSYSFRVAR
ncbi:MAG TPA: hypothetical protein VEY11_12320 [Pyrinomonadaceae bacterium]|nr:hypothetical protein [Pyrinomonadaceae bacterium]